MKMKFFSVVLIATTAVLAASCGQSKKGGSEPAAEEIAAPDSAAIAAKELKTAERIAQMPEEPVFDIITSLGIIKVKLYSDTPKHRENFAKLAFDGFYDGLLFHRVINGFMIQGGDPLTKDPANAAKFGTGGPGYTVEAEILPTHRHIKGALAAARKGDMANPMRESSGSQFYIVQDEGGCASLDGQYTVFGETIEGFSVIDQIAAVQRDNRDRPLNDVKIITVKLEEDLKSPAE